MPLQSELHSILNYDPLTGVFIWKARKQKGFKMSGKTAGAKVKGFIKTVINDEPYFNHRLAWVYTYGDMLSVDLMVDHINNDHMDNRIVNLRLATHSQNCSNAKKWEKKILPKGVSLQSRGGKYRSRLQVGKKVIYLGVFDTPEKAHEVYKNAALVYHGDFARAS